MKIRCTECKATGFCLTCKGEGIVGIEVDVFDDCEDDEDGYGNSYKEPHCGIVCVDCSSTGSCLCCHGQMYHYVDKGDRPCRAYRDCRHSTK